MISLLSLLLTTPALAKNSTETENQQQTNVSIQSSTATSVKTTNQTNKQDSLTTPSVKNTTITPTGNQIKNENEIETQNQGENSQLETKTQENEQSNQNVNESLTKVSDQVHQLINTVGASSGIGQQVKEIAQNQIKLQDEIESNIGQLNSRKDISKFFIGSDKKIIKSIEQQIEQNRLAIQQLEELKLQTTNKAELQQLQETIDLMTSQNVSLQEKINQESKFNGIFGWLINLFD